MVSTNPSIELGDLLVRIDESRGNQPRSEWVREAALYRLDAEEAGEWEPPEAGAAAAVAGGAEP